MGLRGINMKKFISIAVVVILLISCSGCRGKLYEKKNDVVFDNMSFSSGNILNSFDRRLNNYYTAYVIAERTHLDGRNSDIIPEYKLGYKYTRCEEFDFIHDMYNYKIRKNENIVLENIEIVIKDDRFYFSTDKGIDETNNIFKLDTLVGEYASHYVSTSYLKDLQFAVYQSALCYDTLRGKVKKLKEADIPCTNSEYSTNAGFEYYKSDDDRYEYKLSLSDTGWHYSEVDNLTGIKYVYLIRFDNKG